MRYLFLAIDIVIAVGLLSLAIVSLFKQGYKYSINRIFAGFSILVALWIVSNNISNDINMTSGVALFADYIVFSSSFGVLILLTQFIAKLADVDRSKTLNKWLLASMWLVCAISATPLVTAGVLIQGDVYAVIFGPLIWVYAIGIFLMVLQVIYGMTHGLRYAKGVKRSQLTVIGLALLITLPSVLLLSFVIPSLTGLFYVTEFGITPVIFLVVGLYYGVVRYRLFDIRLAVARTGAYVFSLLTLSLMYYCLAYFLSVIFLKGSIDSSVSISPINIALALLLAFMFQPIKKLFDRLTNAVFYRNNYSSDDFFARINQLATLTTDLGDLLRNSANQIAETIKIEQAFFVILREEGKSISAGTSRHGHLPTFDIDILNDYVKNNDGKILDKETLFNVDSRETFRRLMVSHKIELILPLVISGKLIGYLCLGDKKSGRFTSRDINVLKTASDELSIAIQNALAVQEIRDLNDTLQQRVANATKELRASNAILRHLDKTKDEFVRMASHQLRTPLTSVKGYISMVLEGDAGKISDPQRHLLDEAFMSSERMVRLINDFLNVSRLQTGKFVIDKRSVDLSKIIKQEIDSLKPNAKVRDMKFAYDSPRSFPIIDIDEDKIRQVVMNFADNAIFYSHEDTTIHINLRIINDEAVFTVKDTGIGVPVNEQEQLFTKFYRASNARKQRPDGTGVGLFLAKKVIDAHGGKIIFESTEGKGSTFGFRLPIK